MKALLKSLGSSFTDMQSLYKDVDDGNGFLQSVQPFNSYAKFPSADSAAVAFANFSNKRRVVVANASSRNYDNLNYFTNLYNTETTTLFHEMLHLAKNGGTLSHTDIAKSMRSTSVALGDSPMTATRNDGTDFSNPNKNSDGENRDYMNKWINKYCPAVPPPPLK